MEIVKPEDVLRGNPNLNYFGGEFFAKFLMYVLKFNKINKVYKQIGNKQGLDFIDELLRMLEIRYEYDREELQRRVPKEGPFIVVANHPFGGLDGILLIKLISEVRPDVKVLSNFLLQKVEQISMFFLDDNPFERGRANGSGFRGIKSAKTHLLQGGGLCIFPAGEVSGYDAYRTISDRLWQYSAIKFIKTAQVPVVPVYFKGHNSRLFYLMGRIHPDLKVIKLPSEMLNKRNKLIKVRFGSPVTVPEQDSFSDIYQFGRYLRAKTYSLNSKIEVRKFFNYSLKRQQKVEEVASPVAPQLVLQEVKNLEKDHLLFKLKNYAIYCAPSKEMPNILTEIGRLREITFREVGEGTNRSIDLDEFDLYYHQMFIWDEETQKIVGAYRIGKGADILHRYGIRGFYTYTLFRMKNTMEPILMQSMELGRSFVVKEYQRKPMSLFLLWKGILYFILKNPDYRYLFGPVSISNNYSENSKDLIIRFIMAHHFDWRRAKDIAPRNSYKFRSNDTNINILMESMGEDINKLDKAIGDVDELNTGLPVLLKKYIKLNANIIGFNVDPKFNNCLDGLIILDLFDVPKNTIESLSKEANDGSILERFYSNRE
ncbi:MAG: GNAT family N-acyltransferase [Prolixibacteraceae bacterium]|jgi:putative hemolysin|nr:GNAT family N-acyltransferase [Prolixibacteraceae bacterium]